MSWDGSPGRFTDEQYRRACVLDRGGDGPVKERYGLPVREPSGEVNCDGVAAAQRMIGKVKGASAEQLASARSKLEKLAAQCAEKRSRPEPGGIEQRALGEISVEGRTLTGRIPYSTLSRDLGGWREQISPGALRNADLTDLVATVDHVGIPVGRYPGTLTLEDRDDGCHWSVELPESRADVREACARGDLNQSSWRMQVARDSWQGDVRTVEEIRALRDVAVVVTGAYTSAVAELRSQPELPPPEPEEEPAVADEEVTEEVTPPQSGGLTVEARSAPPSERVTRGLADEFRSRGFPGERATMPWTEYESRAVTWAASVDVLSQVRRDGVPLGLDQRYAWPAFARTGVDAGVTSVAVVQQTARALATAANVIRAIDATSTKPETASTVNIVTVPLKQVATVQSGVPNIYLQSPAINTIIENDLRLAINEGLDKLVLDAVAGAGFQAPGTDALLVSIRKAITTLRAAGYSPDTLILTPAADEQLDVLTSGISGGVNDYVFAAGAFAPEAIFRLNRRVSKTAPAPVVADSAALGRLHAGPISLARFEASAGLTNSSNVRLELNAAFGVERVAAAVRIAAS